MREELERVTGRDVSRETWDRLQRYAVILRAEAERQNLIARSTFETLWERHILDSAQLVAFQPQDAASWVDIGSGAGLPGIVVALLTQGPLTLVEPRRLRAEFLARVVDDLGLDHRVSVTCSKVEKVSGRFDTITARAVASLSRFLEMSHHLSTKNSVWILPKGRSAESELAEARRSWHCEARIETSGTDAQARILVLTGVGARKT